MNNNYWTQLLTGFNRGDRMSRLVKFAGLYEFTANMAGGWTVYLNDLDLDSCEPIGSWDSLHEAWTAVGQPDFDVDEDQ